MFLLSLLLTFTAPGYAESARFTILSENQCAPFEGVLLDTQAMAEVFASYDRFKPACDAVIAYELNKQSVKHRYELDTLRVEHNATLKEHDLFIKQKDKEIESLVESLRKTSPRNNMWWFVGGIVVGGAATYGAYKAFDEK